MCIMNNNLTHRIKVSALHVEARVKTILGVRRQDIASVELKRHKTILTHMLTNADACHGMMS